jgi:hypothetical protein
MPAAMLPPAPPRFSTTTVWCSFSERPWPISRATVSATPPGAKATISVIFDDG